MSASAGQLPRAIKGGERFTIAYVLDAKHQEDLIDQKFEMYFRDFSTPSVFRLRGSALLPLAPVVDFGAFSPPAEREIVIRKLKNSEHVRILSATMRSPNKSVTLGWTESAITINVAAAPVGSPLGAVLDVELAGSPVRSQEVRLTGFASGGLVAEPNRIVFGRLRAGQCSPAYEVGIYDDKNRPFVLSKSEFNADALSVRIASQHARRSVCQISALATSPGSINEIVKLTTSDGRRGVVIHCVGMVQGDSSHSFRRRKE